MDRQKDRHINRQKKHKGNTDMYKQRDRLMDGQVSGQTDRQTDFQQPYTDAPIESRDLPYFLT
jgi:hypothetical protein